MKINSKQAIEFTINILQARLTPMIAGDPGIGKSDIVRAIADKFNWELIDVRLSTYDPTDLNGFPMLKGDIATYVPMDTFPLEDTELPDGKKAFLIFLDEFNSASMAVQATSYKLVLDRQVGKHNLHKNTFIVCAGNLETNGAIVNRLSTAMQSRLIHMELTVEPKLWLEWADANQIDHRITSYIESVPGNLHNFKADHNDKTFACPRTWEFTSDLIKNKQGSLKSMMPLLAGTISEGIALEFITHTDLCASIPTFDAIKADPKNIDIDEDPALLVAVSHMVAANLKEPNIPKVMPYINRLPIEFSTVTLKSACRRTNALTTTDEVQDWISKRGFDLF